MCKVQIYACCKFRIEIINIKRCMYIFFCVPSAFVVIVTIVNKLNKVRAGWDV